MEAISPQEIWMHKRKLNAFLRLQSLVTDLISIGVSNTNLKFYGKGHDVLELLRSFKQQKNILRFGHIRRVLTKLT